MAKPKSAKRKTPVKRLNMKQAMAKRQKTRVNREIVGCTYFNKGYVAYRVMWDNVLVWLTSYSIYYRENRAFNKFKKMIDGLDDPEYEVDSNEPRRRRYKANVVEIMNHRTLQNWTMCLCRLEGYDSPLRYVEIWATDCAERWPEVLQKYWDSKKQKYNHETGRAVEGKKHPGAEIRLFDIKELKWRLGPLRRDQQKYYTIEEAQRQLKREWKRERRVRKTNNNKPVLAQNLPVQQDVNIPNNVALPDEIPLANAPIAQNDQIQVDAAAPADHLDEPVIAADRPVQQPQDVAEYVFLDEMPDAHAPIAQIEPIDEPAAPVEQLNEPVIVVAPPVHREEEIPRVNANVAENVLMDVDAPADQVNDLDEPGIVAAPPAEQLGDIAENVALLNAPVVAAPIAENDGIAVDAPAAVNEAQPEVVPPVDTHEQVAIPPVNAVAENQVVDVALLPKSADLSKHFDDPRMVRYQEFVNALPSTNYKRLFHSLDADAIINIIESKLEQQFNRECKHLCRDYRAANPSIDEHPLFMARARALNQAWESRRQYLRENIGR